MKEQDHQDHQLEEMHMTIVPFLSPSPSLDLIDIDSSEVDSDNENVTVHKEVARTPAFRDLWKP